MLQHSKGDGYCRLPPRTTAPTTASVAISNSGQQQQQSLSLPLSPETTLAHFRHLLTDYEASEILAFPSVFFAGASGVEKIGPKARPTGATGAERLNVPGSNASDSSGSAPNGTLAEKFNHGNTDCLVLCQPRNSWNIERLRRLAGRLLSH